MTALSSAEPGWPIDWVMPSRVQAWRTRLAVYSLAPGGVQDDAGDLAAAYRYCHGQGAVGQLGVVVLADCEPEYPPGGHVHHRGHYVESDFQQVELLRRTD
jgi:hypothetical protein